MATFDENGNYIKTNWKAGDKITANKLNKIEDSLEAINNNDISRHVEADNRLDVIEANMGLANNDVINRINQLENEVKSVDDEWGLEQYRIESEYKAADTALTNRVNNLETNLQAQIDQGNNDMEAMRAEVEEIAINMASIGVIVTPSGEDDTNNIQTCLNVYGTVRLSGEYTVSSITLYDNMQIVCQGRVKLSQIQGNTGERVLTIIGSNVVISGSVIIEGCIEEDTGEQNHAVYIRNNEKEISNIKIDNVEAFNIRGDGIYIGGNSSFNPKNIEIGNLNAHNCYRNGLAITGGSNIKIGNIVALQCGVIGVDLESDTQGGHISNISISNIITSNMGILGAGESYPYTEHIKIGTVCLDGTVMNSHPDYNDLDTDVDGLTIRNAKNVIIDSLSISNFDRFAIRCMMESSANDRYNENITINGLVVNNCSLNDTTYNCYVHLGGVKTIMINNVISNTDSNKAMFKGTTDNTVYQKVIVNNMNHTGGPIATFCNCDVTGLTCDCEAPAFANTGNFSITKNSTINATRIASYCVRHIFENNILKWSEMLETSNSSNIYNNNIINETLQ